MLIEKARELEGFILQGTRLFLKKGLIIMKILLLNPPAEKEFALFTLDDYNSKARSNNPPLGLMYLHSYLKSLHDVVIVDMNAENLGIVDIKHILNQHNPDIIGITVVISKWLTVRALAYEIKKINPYIPIVCGGINPSLYPLETLEYPEIDFVIVGFGQVPMMKLCNQLEDGKYSNNIENCYTLNNVPETGHFEFLNIDNFPIPSRDVVNIQNYNFPYFPENPTTSAITSMGCPYSCQFCACKNFKPLIIRKPKNIARELKKIQNLGIKSVLFQDELFTMSITRINNICNAILDNDINLNWSVRSRANLVNKPTIEFMKTAGCFNIHLGIESGTNRILDKMKKNLNINMIRHSVKTIKDVGLSVSASFMIGYPSETESEILKTIEFAESLELNNAQFFIVQPEPNTELYSEIRQNKNLPADIYRDFTLIPNIDDLKNNIASDLISKEQLTDLIKLAYSRTNNLYKINNKQGK